MSAVRFFLSWAETQDGHVAALARHDPDSDLVTVTAIDGRTKHGQRGGGTPESIALALHLELLKDAAA